MGELYGQFDRYATIQPTNGCGPGGRLANVRVIMKVCCLIRPLPHYRRTAFEQGLQACGHEIVGKDGDALLIWNRYGAFDELAREYEKSGRPVIVAENGYIGRDVEGRQLYALARSGHNGSGQWSDVPGRASLLSSWGVTVKPWRTTGRHILVCGQRGIGSPAMASPVCWHGNIAKELQRRTSLPIVVRPHPEELGAGPQPPLDEQLRDAWAVVVWSSAAGVRALVEGVPVFYCAPHWVMADSACRDLSHIDHPPHMVRNFAPVASQQWTVDEITTGEPFKWLM